MSFDNFKIKKNNRIKKLDVYLLDFLIGNCNEVGEIDQPALFSQAFYFSEFKPSKKFLGIIPECKELILHTGIFLKEEDKNKHKMVKFNNLIAFDKDKNKFWSSKTEDIFLNNSEIS